jgi:hypothetical protein
MYVTNEGEHKFMLSFGGENGKRNRLEDLKVDG